MRLLHRMTISWAMLCFGLLMGSLCGVAKAADSVPCGSPQTPVSLIHPVFPTGLRFSSDERSLFSWNPGSLRIWDSSDGTYKGGFPTEAPVHDIAIIDQMRRILTVDVIRSAEGDDYYGDVVTALPYCRIYDLDSGDLLSAHLFRLPCNVVSASASRLFWDKERRTGLVHLKYVESTPPKVPPGDSRVRRDVLYEFDIGDGVFKSTSTIELPDLGEAIAFVPRARCILFKNGNILTAFDIAERESRWSFMAPNLVIDDADVFALSETEDAILARCIDNGYVWKVIAVNDGSELDLHEVVKVSSPVLWTYDSRGGLIHHDALTGDKLEFYSSVDEKRRNVRFRDFNTQHDESIELYLGHAIAVAPGTGRVAFSDTNSDGIHLFDSRTAERIASPVGAIQLTSKSIEGVVAFCDDRNVIHTFAHSHQGWNRVHSLTIAGVPTAITVMDAGNVIVAANDKSAIEFYRSKDGMLAGRIEADVPEIVCMSVNDTHDMLLAGDVHGTLWQYKIEYAGEHVKLMDRPAQWPNGVNRAEHKLRNNYMKDSSKVILSREMVAISANLRLGLILSPEEFPFSETPFESSAGTYLAAKFPLPSRRISLTEICEERGVIDVKTENHNAPGRLIPPVTESMVLRSIVLSSGGRYVSLVFWDGSIIVVATDDWKLVSIVNTKIEDISDVAYDDVRGVLLVASYGGSVSVWDATISRRADSPPRCNQYKMMGDCRINFMSCEGTLGGYDLLLGTDDRGVCTCNIQVPM